ncbi:Alpha/Beta hydrolase protein [Aspergillus minisclerotigenes]|uniref:Alpha/Beta hydrolase protein n=1 Tax=Aspergillus minisclerotigenes TaxID=656917 RepID=A0A5N6J9Z7_9EURO|nr:Alpha/Beta hydrolase protein [Aspergillus minisclerotigenes]
MRLNIHKSFRLSILPVPTLHQVLKRKDPAVFLNVPRFMNCKDELCIRVSEGLCSGYWICQGPPGKPLRPKDSDVVLLWFHGGAYCLGGPLGDAVALLRTAECAAGHGVTASIFSVDYTLAPFATDPRQQEEAVAAYRHLLSKEGIEASRIVVGGESAGGHLALSFPLALTETTLLKPGGPLLLCPWSNLTNESPSFKRNRYKDALNKHPLDRAVNTFIPRDLSGHLPPLAIVNFTRPFTGRQTWKQVLPAHSWISIGGHDIFLDDTHNLVHQARLDGALVDLEITDGEPHGWQFAANKASEMIYSNLPPNKEVPERVMPGSTNVAKGLLEILGKSKSKTS